MFQGRAAADAQALVDALARTPSTPPFASEADYNVAPSWFDADDIPF